MFSSLNEKEDSFGSDVHRLLLPAEEAQKADILTYTSGHLGPGSLNQSQPPTEMKHLDWSVSQSQEETPSSPTLKKRQTKTPASVGKNEIKASPSEITPGSAFVESESSRSEQDQDKDYSSHAGTRDNPAPAKTESNYSNSLSSHLKDCSQKESKFSSCPEGNRKMSSSRSDHEMMKQLDEEVRTEQDIGAERHAAEEHERKLQKELKKLSAQDRPSRDRLAVFSDVFDDVCEGSPVFGRILREIKTEYDLYVNHLMDSQSSQHNTLPTDSVKDGNDEKVSELELDDAVKEVYNLHQEARRALEENRRLQHELENTPVRKNLEDSSIKTASLCGTAADDTAQLQRRQLLNVWKEIQEPEEKIQAKLASAATTAAPGRPIKDVEDLQDKINVVLDREEKLGRKTDVMDTVLQTNDNKLTKDS